MNNLYFTYLTVEYHLGTQEDYTTYTRGKCLSDITESIEKYFKEELNPLNTVKYIRIYKLECGKKFNSIEIDNKIWGCLLQIAYPNANNKLVLTKVGEKRTTKHRCNHSLPKNGTNNGFKRGKENWAYIHKKGISKPWHKRRNIRYRGKWVEVSEEEILREENELKEALLKANGDRSKAAKILKINRNTLYSRMRRHPDIDWNKLIPKREKNLNKNDNSNSRQPHRL